jgi:transposase
MPRPLSVDLRRRIVARWKRGGISAEALGDAFDVDAATVRRLVKLFEQTGSVEPRSHSGGRPPKMTDAGKQWLRQLVQRQPDLTTQEYTDAYNTWSGQALHRSIILRAIGGMGFTRKKSRSWRSSATVDESRPPERPIKKPSKKSNVRVWFLWTKRVPTSH